MMRLSPLPSCPQTNFVRVYGSPDNMPPGSRSKKDAFHTVRAHSRGAGDCG